ncbi:hydrogenase maturation protein [Ideonella sp. TBM-1]|uniref:Hydrogenase maturation protein n=1 Tax=Ideonella livida TaxID=2707176 RepID=A0A7C9PEF3_9BURK|nr:hydrogenase maturation protein [Ideonella livida]
MRLLLLCHSFNGLSQRLWADLRAAGHTVSVELDIADAVTEEALALFQPDLLLAPFLKRRLPEAIWQRLPCLIVHPGPPGDRGPSALDWAVLRPPGAWGVTVLQADEGLDTGRVWASAGFALRPDVPKSSLYRHEVNVAASRAVARALARWVQARRQAPSVTAGEGAPSLPGGAQDWRADLPDALEPPATLGWQPLLRAADRTLDLATATLPELRAHLNAADGHPGLPATLWGQPCRMFDGHAATAASLAQAVAAARARGVAAHPGQLLARRGPAVLLACRAGDGALSPDALPWPADDDGQPLAGLWVGQVRRPQAPWTAGAAPCGPAAGLKLATTLAFDAQAAALPELPVPLQRPSHPAAGGLPEPLEWDELHYQRLGPPGAQVGWLRFAFHNGAMSERQCRRLAAALAEVAQDDTRVLVLAGGPDFFSNGIHLHEIEAAAHRPGDSAADASWRHIEAMDDAALAVLQCTGKLTVALLRGNAGAGGCFLALAADQLWSHAGVVLNPHYKNMGNLYGSEYWTYTLPRRVGAERAREITQGRLPLGAAAAQALGLLDAVLTPASAGLEQAALDRALALAADPALPATLAAKQARRAADEAAKPLAVYRAEELARMRRNFYGFDPSYHVARHHFVYRSPEAWTPRHLALHR